MTFQEFYISSEYKNVAGLCLGVMDFFRQKNLAEDLCLRIEICLNEAVNNVIKHAYRERPGNNILVQAEYTPEHIQIKIKDNGMPRTNLRPPTLEYDPKDINSLPEGGMGLFIISQIMDETDYKNEDGENIFRMKKIIT